MLLFLVVSATDDISSIKLPSFSEIWKANRGGGHRARESPFQMGSGAGTNGCGPDSDSPSLWKSFGDERGGFLPPTTPWVGPQFTESYHRLSFVFFRWIIIVIAPFHKAANQWPRVNGVKHSGFRVALPNTLCNAGLVELECRANICSRAIRGKKRTCVTWELIFDQIQAFIPVPPRVIWYCENRNKKWDM